MTLTLLRLCGAVLVAVALLLQGGCAAPPPPIEIPPKPALFPQSSTAAEPKTPGRVALLVAPDVRAAGATLPALLFKLQAGPMVEQALLRALGDELRGGVQTVAKLPPAGSGFGATLELRWVQLQFRRHAVPPNTIALAFDVALIDAQGRTAWTRTYQDDKDYPFGEHLYLMQQGETAVEAEVRLAHEAAWRLAQQALRDLREWLAAERLRTREM